MNRNFILVLASLLLLPACGPSATSPPAGTEVVVPAQSTDSPGLKQPPTGGIELPPGDVPSPESMKAPAEKSPSGGMQLPDDFSPGANNRPATDASSIDLRYATWDEVMASAAQPGAAMVTILDVWSLGCGPCVKEYPNLVALQSRFPDQIRAIAANVDFDGRKTRPVESYEVRVRDFLKANDATFANYLVQTPSDEVFESLEIASIPTVLVFDRRGRLVKQYVDSGETIGFSYDRDIVPLVEKLLEG